MPAHWRPWKGKKRQWQQWEAVEVDSDSEAERAVGSSLAQLRESDACYE